MPLNRRSFCISSLAALAGAPLADVDNSDRPAEKAPLF